MPWYLGNSFGVRHMWGPGWFLVPGFIIPLALWSLVWTGLSLWHAARRSEKWWFIFFLLVHTAGIVELLYLVFVAKIFHQKPQKSKIRKKS